MVCGDEPMATFVDPRSEPVANPDRPRPRLTAAPEELTELHRLCRDNRLYDIERWIQANRPLQLSIEAASVRRRVPSALEIALKDGNQALVLLLLCSLK